MTDCQHDHTAVMNKQLPNSDVRPASASAAMSPAMHKAVLSSPNSLDARRNAIRQQMVELNRQRLLAQAKCDELRLQEQQFSQQVSICLLYMTLFVSVCTLELMSCTDCYSILYCCHMLNISVQKAV